MKTKIFFMVSAVAFIVFTSCSKKEALDESSINLADDDAVSEAVFDDIFSSVDNAEFILGDQLKGEVKSTSLSDSCPAIIIDRPSDAIWPKTITIDYGTGCTGFYENTRSGKIIIVVTGPRLMTGSKKTVTFDNYYCNGIKVEGTKQIENMGYNANQNLVFSVTLTGGRLTLPDGRTIERSVDREREWVAGTLTRNIWDDEFLVTGTTSGITINGVGYTNTIITPLHWKRVCRFMVSGIVKFEREGAVPVELNYGDGECDAVAVVTRGDESREITLRFRHRLMKNN
ncbi:MAG: hypothetical protein IQL11_01580 [Bacteroidales bacterium]|nr:hypothetical protein [Bacteroidales bacterium]